MKSWDEKEEREEGNRERERPDLSDTSESESLVPIDEESVEVIDESLSVIKVSAVSAESVDVSDEWDDELPLIANQNRMNEQGE